MALRCKPVDPISLCATVALMTFVTAMATWLPALRAMHLEPQAALRAE